MPETSTKEAILAAGQRRAMAHGFSGLNFREIAKEAGIRAPGIYHHFASKADLAAAVVKYHSDQIVAQLESIAATGPDEVTALKEYIRIYRGWLKNDNRMCLCAFMAAEYDDLPRAVRCEVRAYEDMSVAWIRGRLAGSQQREAEQRAFAIYAAVAGAQLIARSRSSVALFDMLIDGYWKSGLIPGYVGI